MEIAVAMEEEAGQTDMDVQKGIQHFLREWDCKR
jgi:hypothetical protein